MVSLHAQEFEGEGLNYQAVARQVDGTVISNQFIEIELAISTDSDGDQVVFQEKHSVVTDNYGLVNVTIGGRGLYPLIKLQQNPKSFHV